MKVEVCMWNSCKSKFSEYIVKRLQNDAKKFGYKKLEICEWTCMWECRKGPNIKVNNWDIQHRSEPAKVSKTVQNELLKKK